MTFLRTAELAALSRPPHKDLPGFTVETQIAKPGTSVGTGSDHLFATAAPNHGNEPRIALGRILDDGGNPKAWFELPVSDLRRHLLIAGMTGSGKTVSCEQLLLELWREHGIPWLVIEPGMKSGYRRLLNSELGGDIDVWAVGVPRTRRLPLNPMAAPVGAALAEHTSALFAVISSAFELVAPMPEVLATAIEQTYRNHGWNLAARVPTGAPPLLTDLIREIDQCVRSMGYDAQIAGNIRAGLLLRLQRLTNGPLAPELTASDAPDWSALTARPTLIELSALPDAASQALLMGLIALNLRHHWRLAGQSDTLRHVTVIEEAHRLLRVVPETAANGARNRATEDLAHMLAELRGFGAGLVIVDQTPSALVPAVIANTATKLLHRLDHPADRELVGRAAGLRVDQVDILGSLRPGIAILRSDLRPRPFRLKMPNPSVTYGAIPAPELPEVEEKNAEGTCPICRKPECAAEREGARRDRLTARLKALQSALQNGTDSAWEWAVDDLQGTGIKPRTSSAPLCFLIAVSRSAGLSESTQQRLRTAFSGKIDLTGI